MLAEHLSTANNSIIIGCAALFTCIVFIIVMIANSMGSEECSNLNPDENERKKKQEPQVVTQQPTGPTPVDICCVPFYFPTPGPPVIVGGDSCCCEGCECCACDACAGCDVCIGCDGCLGCFDACCTGCCEICGTGCCEVCTPELCFVC